jgi:GntR family transcriptional regulator/MocR family aminotransferase
MSSEAGPMAALSEINRLVSGRLDIESSSPLYRQLYDRLRRAILTGNLSPGSKLPSTRGMAVELGIARNTVMAAYERLLAEGYLEGELGSGTYVSKALPEHLLNAALPDRQARGAPSRSPKLSRRGAALAAIRYPVSSEPITPCAFRLGSPALDAFPFELWARLTARYWRSKPSHLLAYGDPAGYRPLREAIAAYLATSRGVQCHPSQVVIVSGSQQGLDLAARVLLDPGESAWIEDPGYRGARGAFLAAGVRLIPVPVDEEGMNFSSVAAKGDRVRLAYVTPAHQYPLGITMSMARRLALLEWANRANAWILEDDYDSEYRYAGRPLAALQGIDSQERVIYLGTFSKVFFPSLRLGYLVVPRSLIDPFVHARALCDGHPPTVAQAVLAEFLTEGHFARHLRGMRHLYAERQEVLVRAASRDLTGLLEVPSCDGGMHLIGWLDEGIDDRAVARRVEAGGIVTMPLSSLASRPLTRGGLLLGYTALDARTIREGVKRLAEILGKSR